MAASSSSAWLLLGWPKSCQRLPSVLTASVLLRVSALNDAPQVAAGAVMDLAKLAEAGAAIDVSRLLASAQAADSDIGALQGLAVTGSSGNGSWQFSSDGQRWLPFGSVSATHALLLAPGTQLRYVAAVGVVETASFDFRAWDQSSGQASQGEQAAYADTSQAGGDTAFSHVQRAVSLRAGTAGSMQAPGSQSPGTPNTPSTPSEAVEPDGAAADTGRAGSGQTEATERQRAPHEPAATQAAAGAALHQPRDEGTAWQPPKRGAAQTDVDPDPNTLLVANAWTAAAIDFNLDAAGPLVPGDAGHGYTEGWLKRLLASGARQVEDSLVQLEIPGVAQAQDAPASAVTLGAMGAAGITMTAGMLWWLTRGGGMLFSVLMGVPAWRHIDLLPIVARQHNTLEHDDTLDDDGEDDDWPGHLHGAAGGDTLAPDEAEAQTAARSNAGQHALPTA